jgi:hypothetical protein
MARKLFLSLLRCALWSGLLALPIAIPAQQRPAGAAPAGGDSPPGGTLYKCAPTNDGKGTLITDDPNDIKGRDCTRVQPQRINVVPFPRATTKSGPDSKAGARVDTGAQRARDSDRRRILEDELANEQKRLTELKAEFNNGEPERRGDERNYQRYTERVEKLKADISRSEANVESLRRELGAVRN